MSKTSQRKLTIDPVKQASGPGGLGRPRSTRVAQAARAQTQQDQEVKAAVERRERFQIPTIKYTQTSTRH